MRKVPGTGDRKQKEGTQESVVLDSQPFQSAAELGSVFVKC